MRVDPFSCVGWFWSPERPETRFYGRLTVPTSGFVELELFEDTECMTTSDRKLVPVSYPYTLVAEMFGWPRRWRALNGTVMNGDGNGCSGSVVLEGLRPMLVVVRSEGRHHGDARRRLHCRGMLLWGARVRM